MFSQDFPSRNSQGILRSPIRFSPILFSRLAVVVTGLLLPAMLAAQNPPQLTLLDPVPALLSGPMVTSKSTCIADSGASIPHTRNGYSGFEACGGNMYTNAVTAIVSRWSGANIHIPLCDRSIG